MLGATPIAAVLGAAPSASADLATLKAFAKSAASVGLAVLLIEPGSKIPVDMRSAVQRRKDDEAAQDEAKAAGRADWSKARSKAGSHLATTDATHLGRYLTQYRKRYATPEVPDVAVNFAVEVGRSRLVVVDADTADQVAAFLSDAGIEQPIAPTVQTPGAQNAAGEWVHADGGHFYFTIPEGVELPERGTWTAPGGYVVMWRDRYVLIPPSVRPEGAYQLTGREYPLPDWLLHKITEASAIRAARKSEPREGDEDMATAIDAWAEATEWGDILSPGGWTLTARADNCGCAVWTAPGDHHSPKSATTHDTGCDLGRYTLENAPMHVWTDDPGEDFAKWIAEHQTKTITKLQALAITEFGGDVGTAASTLGLIPEADLGFGAAEARELADGVSHDAGVDAGNLDRPLELPEADAAPGVPEFDWNPPMPGAPTPLPDEVKAERDAEPLDMGKDSTAPEGSWAACEIKPQPEGTVVCTTCHGRGRTPCLPGFPREVGTYGCHVCDRTGYVETEPETQAEQPAEDTPADEQADPLGFDYQAGDETLRCPASPTGVHVWGPITHDAQAYRSDAVQCAHCYLIAQGDDPVEDFATRHDGEPYQFGPADADEDDTNAASAAAVEDDDILRHESPGVPVIAPFNHWRDMPAPEFAIDGILEHQGLSCVIGPPGAGKSALAIDMACSLVTGTRWQGRKVIRQRVLYLPGEGLSGAVQRIKAWELGHGKDVGNDLLLGNSIIQLAADRDDWATLAGYMLRHRVGLIIFDTFARMSLGIEENSATDVGKAITRFDQLKKLTGAGIMLVHHTGKNSTAARGSSALNGAVDTELLVVEGTWDASGLRDEGIDNPRPLDMFVTKQKNDEKRDEPIPLHLTSMHGSVVVTGPAAKIGDPLDTVAAAPLLIPEPLVETVLRIRTHVNKFSTIGVSRAELVRDVQPDDYIAARHDSDLRWKRRVAEAVDLGMRYEVLTTTTGLMTGAKYVPGETGADAARRRYADEGMAD